MSPMTELIHNGIMITEIEHIGLKVEIDGKEHILTPKQEQMALAWVKKLSTVYVEDPIFCENFFNDFSEALGYKKLTDENIDFTEVIEYVENERAKREALTKEEKKQAREERKIIRDKLIEKYGTATLDGKKVEISNWTAEPSSIFMGRGEHPMRGKWKDGPTYEDITLNHSPHSEMPPGNWKEIIWEPECLWIAKWDDKLSGKTKYVWLSDTTPIKQDREIEKYDKAKLVGNNLEKIRSEILLALDNGDKRRRKVATACFIIDQLNMRVGDEKDEDEADTVGATTLRPEHITIKDNVVYFDFLGKDSVVWKKEKEFPEKFIKMLQELIEEANKSGEEKPQIFSDITSRHVNSFLSEIVDGLTAKVFRTFYATNTVKSELDQADVNESDPEFVKKEVAVMANLEAAIICNHMKQVPANWSNRLQKFRERKIKADERIAKAEANQKQSEVKLDALKENLKEKKKSLLEQEKILENVRDEYKALNEDDKSSDLKNKEKFKKDIEKAKRKVDSQKKRIEAANKRVEVAQNQIEKGKNSVGTAKERVYRAKLAYKKIDSQERISKKTKEWNLGTSLKSYIDPRVYFEWGKEVDYNWRNYYSNTLQKKFSWLEREEND
ncbi:MAG: DNA topoisomerase I [Candidatus Heimdallarchaeota archaeon]|nr:DNA topoisomerase I [Candidatus Heimdallarchaeota archaeon]